MTAPVSTRNSPAAARPELLTGPVRGNRRGLPPVRDGGVSARSRVVRVGVAVAVAVAGGAGAEVTAGVGRVAVTIKAVAGRPKSEL